MLKERISKHLNIPYIYLPDQEKILCSNGVLFSLEEYKKGIDINAEYERRLKEDMLYDYAFAKSTQILRKKRGYTKAQEEQSVLENREQRTDRAPADEIKVDEKNTASSGSSEISRRNDNSNDKQKEVKGKFRSSLLIILILSFASICSMYESTLHTATYLFDYVDIVSAWLLSTAVTAYNSSAFEVSVMFHNMKRNFMAFIFMLLWGMVTLFSMATTVSVFYDRYNFNETQIAQENKETDSNKLALEILKQKEQDLREDIKFKKKDIEYRQEKEYATSTVRKELNVLQEELQKNLTEQQKLLKETPEVVEEKIQRKESLFAFLGRMLHLEGGILEFTMSTLSAVFVNLIAPLTLTAVVELNKRKDVLTK